MPEGHGDESERRNDVTTPGTDVVSVDDRRSPRLISAGRDHNRSDFVCGSRVHFRAINVREHGLIFRVAGLRGRRSFSCAILRGARGALSEITRASRVVGNGNGNYVQPINFCG